MEKFLISIPDQLALRMRTTIPRRQRSKIIAYLIEKEIEKREDVLHQCALDVEKDSNLQREMADWDVTLNDGLSDKETLTNRKHPFKKAKTG